MHTKQSLWIIPGVCILIWIGSMVIAAKDKPSEKMVAVVNGTVIAQSDLNREMKVQQWLLRTRKHLTGSKQSVDRDKVLENLINTELLFQESLKEGVKVDEAAINKQLETLEKQFPQKTAFSGWLSNMDLTEITIRSHIKKGLSIQQFIEKKFANKITVTEKEIKLYYDNHPDMFKLPEQVKASHILIKTEPNADKTKKDEARKQLEKIRERIKNGEDFATLAKEFSQGPSNSRGGDLGYFRRGQMMKPFEDAAFSLPPGQISDIVETTFGYHLIKVIDKKPASIMAFNDVKKGLVSFLKQSKIQKETLSYTEELKKKAKVEIGLNDEPDQ